MQQLQEPDNWNIFILPIYPLEKTYYTVDLFAELIHILLATENFPLTVRKKQSILLKWTAY
jgi:hypothetical protein